jgi:hypothetical protein
VPAPARPCTHCGGDLEPSNEASLCFQCALRGYLDLRPGAGRLHGAASGADEWRAVIGFAPEDGLYATTGRIMKRPGYAAELYAVRGLGSYLAGQIHMGGPTGSGSLWLARVRCPSGMVYEAALPAGLIGDDTRPQPDRTTRPPSAMDTYSREVRVARAFVNKLPRNPGGAPAADVYAQVEEYRALLPANLRKARECRGGKLLKADLSAAYGWSEDTLTDRMKKAGDTMAKLRRRPGGSIPR